MAKEAKATRVNRVAIEGNAVTFTPAHGVQVAFDVSALPAASQQHLLHYGIRQFLNDSLAGEDDKEAAGKAAVERLKSGDFTRSRTSAGLTLQSVAVMMVQASAAAKGVSVTQARIKELAKDLLLDEAKAEKVRAKLEELKATSADSDLDIDI